MCMLRTVWLQSVELCRFSCHICCFVDMLTLVAIYHHCMFTFLVIPECNTDSVFEYITKKSENYLRIADKQTKQYGMKQLIRDEYNRTFNSSWPTMNQNDETLTICTSTTTWRLSLCVDGKWLTSPQRLPLHKSNVSYESVNDTSIT